MKITAQNGKEYELEKGMICYFKKVIINRIDSNMTIRVPVSRIYIGNPKKEICLGEYDLMDVKDVWDSFRDAVSRVDEYYVMPK